MDIFDIRVTWGIKDGKKVLLFYDMPHKNNKKNTKIENDYYIYNNKHHLQRKVFRKKTTIYIVC